MISKWEKGLSVPDADILIRDAEILEVSVGGLLGSPIDPSENVDVVAQKLEQINFSLAERNRRSRLLCIRIVKVTELRKIFMY